MNLQYNLQAAFATAAAVFLTVGCDESKPAKPSQDKIRASQPQPVSLKQELPTQNNISEPLNPKASSFLSEGGDLSSRPPLKERVPSARGSTQLHPAVEKARIALSDELTSVLADKQKTASIIRDRWTKSVTELPNTVLQSSGQPRISSGAELAPELKAMMANETEFASSLLSGSYHVLKSDTEIISAALVQTLASGMMEQLPEALHKHAAALPPSESDIVILAAAFTAITNSPPDMANLEPWQELAAAPNPAYRLIALRAARQGIWAQNSISDRLAFASAYDNETDTIIVLELAIFLGTVPGSEALLRLESLQNAAATAGNVALSEEVAEARRSHALISNSNTDR